MAKESARAIKAAVDAIETEEAKKTLEPGPNDFICSDEVEKTFEQTLEQITRASLDKSKNELQKIETRIKQLQELINRSNTELQKLAALGNQKAGELKAYENMLSYL